MLNELFTSVWLFDRPHARLFYLNIISALILALIFIKKDSLKERFKAIVDKEIWLHPSALVDYKLYFFNAFFKVLLLAPWMITSFTISVYFMKGMFWAFPGYSAPRLSNEVLLIRFTLLAFLISDFFH